MVRLNKDKLDDDVLWLERMMRRNKENAERRKREQWQEQRLADQKARQGREWMRKTIDYIAALPEPKLPPPDITVSTDGTSPKGFEGEMWIDSDTGELKVLLNGEWVVSSARGTGDKQKGPEPKKEEREEKPKPRRKLDLSL